MFKFRNTLLLIGALGSWIGQSSDQAAQAQIRVQRGAPSYYGSQPVYRSTPRVYSQPSQRYVQPSLQSSQRVYVSPSPQYSSGYGTYSTPHVPGQTYQSYRPTYTSPPTYGNPVYGNPVYGNSTSNGYYYGTPSQQRGATVGGAIGNAIGGDSGANVGAAIGAAIQGR